MAKVVHDFSDEFKCFDNRYSQKDIQNLIVVGIVLDFTALTLFLISEMMVENQMVYFLLCQNITAASGFHLIYIWQLLQALGAALLQIDRPAKTSTSVFGNA